MYVFFFFFLQYFRRFKDVVEYITAVSSNLRLVYVNNYYPAINKLFDNGIAASQLGLYTYFFPVNVCITYF